MWINISSLLTSTTPVWPGDVPVTFEPTASMEQGASINLAALQMSLHAGTHADAPLHTEAGGAPSDVLALEAFIGEALLVDIPEGEPVSRAHLKGFDLAGCRRLLLRTRGEAPPPRAFERDFQPILPDTVDWMAEQSIVLVGTDAASVDPFDSTELEAHHALNRYGIVNLENLMLGHVEPGRYTLVALPLAVAGMDAAPVRAVLGPPGLLGGVR